MVKKILRNKIKSKIFILTKNCKVFTLFTKKNRTINYE